MFLTAKFENLKWLTMEQQQNQRLFVHRPPGTGDWPQRRAGRSRGQKTRLSGTWFGQRQPKWKMRARKIFTARGSESSGEPSIFLPPLM